MKLTQSFLAAALSFSLAIVSFLSLAVSPVSGQDSRVALQRGYRTGYSDGYMAGYRDVIDNLGQHTARHKEFIEANRAYNKEYGPLDDYRDGYRQGFESGYLTGFDKLAFDSTVPSGLARKGVGNVSLSAESEPQTVSEATLPVEEELEEEESPEPVTETVEPAAAEPVTPAVTEPVRTDPLVQANAIIKKASYITNDDPIIIIPRDTELIIELQEDMSTETNRDGDRFTAKIVSPQEIAGATIEGRIDRIQKPGRIKRRSQIELSFDRIILNENRWSNFGAILTEVMPVKGDNVRRVDNEGTAIGKSSVKDDSIKVGAATGAGLGIGAITAGPVGAAIGAGVGAAFGVGAAVVERGKHIRLNRNQQLKIRAAYETQIR